MKKVGRIFLSLAALLLVFSLTSCSFLLFGNSKNQETSQPTYTITYDLGDGTVNTVTYRSSDPDYVPDDPARAGYRFLYWTLDGKDGQYNGVVRSGSSGNITFRAVWELVEYTLTYRDVDSAGDNPASYNVESADIVLSEPTKSGYYFLGWQLPDGQLKKNVTIPTGSWGDLVFTAKWSATLASFQATANIDVPITANIGEQYLKTDTPIRVSAPVYAGDNMFSHWELNGSRVAETAFFTFPMLAVNTEIKAVYVSLDVITYQKASGGSKSVLFGSRPTYCLGGNAKEGTDVTLDATGVTFTADYLQSLDPGDYRFCLATVSGSSVTKEKTFILRVVGSATPSPDYSGLTDTARTFYNQTFTFKGKTWHRVASTEEEFRAMVEYFVFVEGALQMQRDNDRTKEYSFRFYAIGDFEKLSAHVSDISFPMHPKISYQRSGVNLDKEATVTLKVIYQNGLNDTVSSQVKNPLDDRQKLLTPSGRPSDYDSFPIDALPASAIVRTIYELEFLPFGMKPSFAEGAEDVKEVYDAARAILRTIVDDGMDDYAKVSAIYAWLGENVTYDQVAFAAENSDYAAYTVKGALIDRIAVCDGYASALRLLCQIEGIRAEEVTGICQQQGQLSGHAWNKVWIGGAVYGVDSTWARPLGSDFITLQYLFMNETDLLETQHYENSRIDPDTNEMTVPYVSVLADSRVENYRAVRIDKAGHDFVVNSKVDVNAIVLYLHNNGISAAEFLLKNDSLTFYNTDPYTVYSSTNSDYSYIVLD